MVHKLSLVSVSLSLNPLLQVCDVNVPHSLEHPILHPRILIDPHTLKRLLGICKILSVVYSGSC